MRNALDVAATSRRVWVVERGPVSRANKSNMTTTNQVIKALTAANGRGYSAEAASE